MEYYSSIRASVRDNGHNKRQIKRCTVLNVTTSLTNTLPSSSLDSHRYQRGSVNQPISNGQLGQDVFDR
jgi:hypothetical protein